MNNKRFNTTGVCIPKKHYMVDISSKLDKIEDMVNRGEYFVINRPRQYGKTTTMYMLKKRLNKKYLVMSCSFEGVGDLIFENEASFSKQILSIFADSIEFNFEEYAKELNRLSSEVSNLKEVSKALTKFLKAIDEEVVLLIDEVDKSSNNQLFLSFLGMLRNKYLLKEQEEDYTFRSVILAGVHDIKNLKLKLRPDEEKKLNSPWNIAVKFDVDMSFNPEEIETMLIEFCNENEMKMDTKKLAEKLYYYTNGYPFLVSRLCQIVDEDILEESKEPWSLELIDRAVKIILDEKNTLFESLIVNIANNKELYEYVFDIIINGTIRTFNNHNQLIELGMTYGFFRNSEGKVKINNRIFDQVIYNYLASNVENTERNMSTYNFKDNFITADNGLDFTKILLKYQQFMKEQYSNKDAKFIEREGRLLFQAFIKPIINGVGFDFKEVQIAEEKRLDIVITYNHYKYIVELKIWYGEEYHKKGLKQLAQYLNINSLEKGYLVVYNFNVNKQYESQEITIDNKNIFVVYV